ncbi:MAG TPA: MscL family protein [bacterium]|nr:MscL family protein [bacterium]
MSYLNIPENQSESIKKINKKFKEAPFNFIHGLMAFLKEYSVIGLAIGLIIGQASKDLVDKIVAGIFMPLIQLIISKEKFADMNFSIKGVVFDFGSVLNSFLTFLIVMALLYFIIKKIIKNDALLEKK